MKKKRKSVQKVIDFQGRKLQIFSKFQTHPITGLTFLDLNDCLDWLFLIDLDFRECKTKGRPLKSFVPFVKAILVMFIERLPSQRELERVLQRRKEVRDFCGFARSGIPSKSSISRFLNAIPLDCLEKIFLGISQQLQAVEYEKSDTIAVDGCTFRTLNKLPDRKKVMKRNNETSEMKKVYGIKHTAAVCTKRMVCTGFITDFEGHHETKHWEPALDHTIENGFSFKYALGDKGFDSAEIRNSTILKYLAIPIIPEREYESKTEKQKSESVRERRRILTQQFTNPKEDKKYDERTAVERYFSKLEFTLGLDKLKTKREKSGRSLIILASTFDTIARIVHLKKTIANSIVPLHLA